LAYLKRAAPVSPTVALAGNPPGSKGHVSLSPWERYAQALLLTNEFVFVD
jgi:hypothetical protein